MLETTGVVYKEGEQAQGTPGTPKRFMETETGEDNEGFFCTDCLITGPTRELALSQVSVAEDSVFCPLPNSGRDADFWPQWLEYGCVHAGNRI